MSEKYEASGEVIKIGDVQTFDSGFTKRELVVEIPDGKYSETVLFELVKDKTSLLDGLTVGENVKVSFNLKGREWEGRYFVNLQAWKIDKAEGGQAAGNAAQSGGEDTSDIPFGRFQEENFMW